MGGAYGKGFVEGLKEYIKSLPKAKRAEILISLVVDFDPLEADDLNVDQSIKTQQFMHKSKHWYDNIFGCGWLANSAENGIDLNNLFINMVNSDHSILSFGSEIQYIQEGTYKWDGNNWILQPPPPSK